MEFEKVLEPTVFVFIFLYALMMITVITLRIRASKRSSADRFCIHSDHYLATVGCYHTVGGCYDVSRLDSKISESLIQELINRTQINRMESETHDDNYNEVSNIGR